MTQTAKREGLQHGLSRFYVRPHADKMVPRREVFALLRWYHESIVEPNRGIAGLIRRAWWRLTRQHHKLLSPWRQLEIRAQQMAAMEAAEGAASEKAGANGGVGPLIEMP